MSDREDDVTRRRLLRGAGAAAGSSLALTTTAGTAAAHTSDGEEPSAEIPVAGGVEVKFFDNHAHLRGLTYVGSLAYEDLCAFGKSACVIGGAVGGIWSKLRRMIRWVPLGYACAVTVSGCEIKNVIQRFAPDQIEYVDIYNVGGDPSQWVAAPRVRY